MSKNNISADISRRICIHMNQDHKEAILTYLKHFGKITPEDCSSVSMKNITTNQMTIEYDKKTIEIELANECQSSKEIHQTLVEMIKKAA
tara:strand:- start:5164 stop:5433 length:270 start_codon:yes stop_codon:yes gene_type:complete